MLSKEEVLHLLNEAKKEVDRLETNRQEDLGNSINYIENELQLVAPLSFFTRLIRKQVLVQ